MALSPDGDVTPTPTRRVSRADVVAVLQSDSNQQVFAKARPTTATIYETAKLMEHPLEDGSTIADHIVFEPNAIDLPVRIAGKDAAEVFDQIRQLWRAGTVLTVQTRIATYANMVILEVPHDERPDEWDSTLVGLRFRQAIFVKSIYGGLAPKAVKNKAQASTAKRGAQQTTTAPVAHGSLLQQWFGGMVK